MNSSNNNNNTGTGSNNNNNTEQATNNNNAQQQQNTTNQSEHKRSPSKDSINPVTCPFPHTVKEAVAIAAGKKENGGDDDDGKTIRSNMLCYLYWLLVVLILGLISFTVWLSIQLARRHSEINEHRKTFEFEDIFNTTFHPKTFHVTWIREDAYVYRSKTGCLHMFNVTKNASEKILDSSIFEKYKSSQYMLSGDLKYVVLQYDNIKVWRHSQLSKYVIYDRHVKPGTPRMLHFGEDKQPGHDDIVNKHLQVLVMAPTSSAAAFVYKNNLFIQASPAPRNPARQLTFSGSDGQVYNGVNDWTYENMLKRSSSIWWSPDSKYFCYLSINDSNVTNFKFILRKEGPEADVISIPHPRVIPYGNIPEVTVRLVDTEKLKDEQHQTVLRAPQEFRNIDHYVVNVVWKDSTHVAVVWHTRPHNQSITTLYDVVNEATSNLHYQISATGWIEIGHPITFLKSSTSYLTIFPKLESDETLWNHLALIEQQDMQDSKVTYLTAGHQDVRDIVGFDADASEVFFTSTNGNQTRKHLFRCNVVSRSTSCMTCNETSDCQYVAANFGPKAKHYILGCLGPRIPTYELKTVDSERSLMLEDNKKLAEALTAKILPDRKHITVAVGNGQTATVELIEPQEEGSKKFPLLILASGEPGTQQVSDRFHLGWETYLASKEEVVVAKVDGRGSGGRGVTYRNQIHKKLTEMDVEDHQLIALFLKHHELVDPAKVAILGWGHSGLVAMHSLANDSDIFPCGITGGALLDPHYYDAPFFEKYMGLSNQNYNLQAILKTGVASKLTNLRTKKLALIQALGDDHISYASTSNALKVLEDNDILFRYQIYRDLSSSRLTPHRHVYHLMTDFLKNDCFAYFWKHDTKSWIVDKSVKKDKFRIKQFCV